MNATKTTAKRTSTAAKGFTDDEKAAMKERAKELKAAKADGEGTLLAKLAEMPPEDRAMGEKIHSIMKANAPTLEPKTWYGMPAYAKDGKVICFFQPASKFGARYSTFGFNDDAKLDDGTMWPTSFALTKLSAADEATITKLVKKAIGD